MSEVCSYTDTQPYILRFWESEFPQLAPEKSKGGQSIYSRQDLDLVLQIKRLLYEEEFTIDGARKELERGGKPAGRGKSARSRARAPEPAPKPEPRPVVAPRQERPQAELFSAEAAVSRDRYEGAVEEISHLRMKLRDAESRMRKAELAAQKAEQVVEAHRQRDERVARRLEELLKRLSASS